MPCAGRHVEEHVSDRIFVQTADNGQRYFKPNFNVGATVHQFCASKHKVAVGPRIEKKPNILHERHTAIDREANIALT